MSNPRQMTKMANHRWSGPQDLTWDLPDIFCLWLQRDSWHFWLIGQAPLWLPYLSNLIKFPSFGSCNGTAMIF